jgi:hypothetical protein
VQGAGFHRQPQRLAGADQVLLANHLIQRGGAQGFGQRFFRFLGKQIIHGG